MLQSTSRRHENTGKMWSHIKKRTDSKINLFSFAIMLVLLRSLFPSHDLLKLSSTQYSVRVPCLFSWQELSSSGKVVQLVSSPPRRQLATRHSYLLLQKPKKASVEATTTINKKWPNRCPMKHFLKVILCSILELHQQSKNEIRFSIEFRS